MTINNMELEADKVAFDYKGNQLFIVLYNKNGEQSGCVHVEAYTTMERLPDGQDIRDLYDHANSTSHWETVMEASMK